jgi:hypothetical protein
MVETDLAWAAGFLDGEGYFGLRKQTAAYFVPVIEAAQVATREPLDKLALLFGGSVNRRSGQRVAWTWKLAGAKAVLPALAWLMAYLVVKREQAAIVLAASQTVRNRNVPVSELEVAFRQRLADDLVASRRTR